MAEPLTDTNPSVTNAIKALTESIIRDKQLEAKAGASTKENVPSQPAQKAAPTSGKKRKAETSLDDEIEEYTADLDNVICTDDFENDPLPSCSSVRAKMKKLFDSGIMTKADFCRATGANSNSLNSFLKQKGPYGGSGSSVWRNAYNWFKQREVMGLKMPDPKKRRIAEAKKKGADGQTSKGESLAKSPTTGLPDISGIHLPFEEEDDVPVYDDCDEIRRKINAHLRTTNVTQAQFCRDLYAQFKTPKFKGIQSKQLSDFRSTKGSNCGAKSSVYYTAYVYFEKLRIAQGKPMSQHHALNMDLNPGGLPRDVDGRAIVWYLGAA
ncbi:hypothetical protein FPOAC2_06356 [Fusarium poae]|jgi:hypothetical protein|uniref:hypothetical protein n=1 Tax=Fusarium poae TaxID=36050 RepID=UPI001CE98DD3|nr:hypothetical protein FPOAC1_006237 [Fusarium poae]KAG8672937.1 hypothetical protein FPOAC1_006237 [Fusarium poae]